VLDQLVELFEGPLVEQQVDPLARGELALPVLALATLGAASLLGAPDAFPQVVERGAGHWCYSRGQAPPPQAPAPQPPASGEQAAAPHPANGGDGDAVATAKTESCFSTSVDAQPGQATASPKRRTSFSKFAPHAGQAYS
jgi:hypothetical protein